MEGEDLYFFVGWMLKLLITMVVGRAVMVIESIVRREGEGKGCQQVRDCLPWVEYGEYFSTPYPTKLC